MNDATSNSQQRLSRYLPGIYQEAAKPDTPLHALLSIFEGFIGRIEQGIEDAPDQFDPYAARYDPGSAQLSFLDWLASWVTLPLDDEWNTEDQKTRKSYLIAHAAELYKRRGTAAGLKYMLSAFYELDAEVLEWTWPAGMQIGVTSTMGENCNIMDQPDLRRCFVLAVRPDETQKEKMAPFVDLISISLLGHEEKSVSIPMRRAEQAEGERFIRRLEKIRYLIENEKPAHTRFFVVIEEPRPVRAPVIAESMTIGVYSTIGLCVIA